MNKYPLKYPPGSSWLFIRIYGGPQALEGWLIGRFRMMLESWKESGIVERFHYLHYLDPDYHLRLRFYLSDPVRSGDLLTQIARSCEQLMEDELVWKIEVGTYEPEYERYGIQRMLLVEEWFGVDSECWLNEISDQPAGCDQQKWKSAMRSVDALLNDFGAILDEKVRLTGLMKESLASITGITKQMRLQLDGKYRKMAGEVEWVMAGIPVPGYQIWQERTNKTADCVKSIQATFESRDKLLNSSFLPDLIHMSLNRAFRTRHRYQELVVYDFLSRYYESVKARNEKSGSIQPENR